jgi:eukaryotic-like serine/threonine-protein kinase
MQPELIAGRYQVLRAIGRGGMGTVWLCRDQVLGRDVAVKQIGALPGESATETKRAMREARSAAALNHPNAVAVYDVVKHDGRPWLVMEYVDGQTLADEISRDGQLSPQRVADIGAQLAGALARAHERRIVHRDIKPGNVLIDKAGRPKISDFGIARGHGDEQLTQVGFITGTPGYLSPELARGGDPHPASDVWALGATLYTAVEGQPPYEPRSNPIAVLRAIATERPRPMTHAGALGPAIDAMMDADPARRWDMATSAKRLGGVARITSLMPRVDLPGTAVTAAPLFEPTQTLEPTQRLEAAAPVAKPPVAKPPVAAVPVAKPPVVAVPVAKSPVAKPPVVAVPVAKSPVAKPPVVAVPVAKPPVAAVPVAESPVVAVPVLADPVVIAPVLPLHDRRSAPRWLPLVLVSLLVVVLGVAYLSQLGRQGGTTTGTASKTTSAKPNATGAPKISEQPTATSPAPAVVTAAPAPNAEKRLENFVKSYYSEVTQDTSRTWGQLTPTMQQSAGGRSGYDGFWGTISGVKVNQTQANSSVTQATVNLTFTRKDGTTSTENHQFTFVAQSGGYLINSDKFLG